jgi:tetratricopeptide (TPR) repeat protein
VSRTEGEAWLAEAAGEGADAETRFRAMEALAASMKACGRDDEAARIWREMADLLPEAAGKPLVELAKHYEHRMKDYDRAIECLDEAARLPECAEDPALAHRRARLERKRR